MMNMNGIHTSDMFQKQKKENCIEQMQMYLNIQVKEEDQGKENKYDKND